MTPSPFLKWAGGKRQLLPELRRHLPVSFNRYYEPFIGAGALLFDLQPGHAVINDINPELINCYRIIRDQPAELLADLSLHLNEPDYFYAMRSLDRSTAYSELSPVQRASRIIYLNKTCFNGLFRVNSRGEFNAPFGRYKKPAIINEAVILAVSQYLQHSAVEILNTDFKEAVKTARRNDFVYFDPPYDPLSDTSSFTGYSRSAFGHPEQERLRDLFEHLTAKGVKLMLSNSSTAFIRDLYRDYNIVTVQARRNINSVGKGRAEVDEVLVLNYVP
ncbi:MAG: DNA adenine methylase [Bacteroidota bacterium]